MSVLHAEVHAATAAGSGGASAAGASDGGAAESLPLESLPASAEGAPTPPLLLLQPKSTPREHAKTIRLDPIGRLCHPPAENASGPGDYFGVGCEQKPFVHW